MVGSILEPNNPPITAPMMGPATGVNRVPSSAPPISIGRTGRPDFAGVDVRPLPTVKYVCNAWEIDQHVDEQSVDEIFSRHFFEHLTFEHGAMTLQSWFRVLNRHQTLRLAVIVVIAVVISLH